MHICRCVPVISAGFHGRREERVSRLVPAELRAHEVMGAGSHSDQSHAALRVALRAAVHLPVLRRDRPEPSPDGLRAHLLRSVREGVHVRTIHSLHKLNNLLYINKDKHNFLLKVHCMQMHLK